MKTLKNYDTKVIPVNNSPKMMRPLFESEDQESDNIFDYYQDHLDEYLDDPEDEITYPPEIFDFLDD